MSIEIKDLCKKYGDKEALHDFSLTVEPNKIYGLLGRNGAGKTTLLNILANRIFATGGSVIVDGVSNLDSTAAQSKIYMISEQNYIPYGMRVGGALKWISRFYDNFDMQLALSLSEKFGLSLKSRISSLSTGYKSVFKIIAALSVNTPYLLFDEPTQGLDPAHREMFYKLLIEKYAQNPCTVILSTHQIDEIAAVIEKVVIIDRGRLLRSDSVEELLDNGYTVSGKGTDVDEYIKDKKVIGVDRIGSLKSACIEGRVTDRRLLPDGLEITPLDLQQLFTKLTDNQKGDRL